MRVIVNFASRFGHQNSSTHVVGELGVNGDGSVTLQCMTAVELGGTGRAHLAQTFTLDRALVAALQGPAVIDQVRSGGKKRG